MNEGVATNRNADMGRAGRLRVEEEQVAGQNALAGDRSASHELVLDRTRQCDSVSSEDIPSESAAIEACRVDAAVLIGGSTKVERRSDEGILVNVAPWGSAFCPLSSRRPGARRGKGPRYAPCAGAGRRDQGRGAGREPEMRRPVHETLQCGDTRSHFDQMTATPVKPLTRGVYSRGSLTPQQSSGKIS